MSTLNYAPVFAKFGPEVAATLTQHLMADKVANKAYWNNPAKWPELYPYLRTQLRSLTFSSTTELTGTGVSVSKNLKMVGGRNCVLISRRATVLSGSPADGEDYLHKLVTYSEEVAGGSVKTIPDTPIVSCFNTTADSNGNGYLATPESWVGNEDRTVVCTDKAAVAVAVHLTYEVVTLIVGTGVES